MLKARITRCIGFGALFLGLGPLIALTVFALLFQKLYLPWYWDLENHPVQFYGYPLGLLACGLLAICGAVILYRLDKNAHVSSHQRSEEP
jgi:hypothetical protein